jgi:GT2 family glycosyltransferase
MTPQLLARDRTTSDEVRPVAWDVAAQADGARPRVRGKFLFLGKEKLYIRGVTYGTFRSDEQGEEPYRPDIVERDFAQMAAAGVNAARVYTVPPRWLLDSAQRHGLLVMVGLPWEQHIAFLDERARRRAIEHSLREGVRACAGHPALLGFAIGNEIPASIVRWYGRRRVERYLERLYRVAKEEDPGCLVTYVNYPSTEYLRLPFIDFTCFNVYLETQEDFAAYLARLHNIAGDRPLLMGEIGLDSRRHGEEAQADTLGRQVRAAFGGGCAGAFVFAWTDEWHRGGEDIEDWDFGLTDRARRPKAALGAVHAAFADVPVPADLAWPRISVVVCSRNGGRTIRDCCEGLARLVYPDYEVIVVDDGSTDETAEIARSCGLRVISTENRGLGAARTLGLEMATGEIVAYLDDDACPDPHWLTYLATTFMTTEHAGVGGPNIAVPEDGAIAECVANAPGGPIHILLSDQEAEHIPGCNMAFRKECLEAIGGFDAQFRIAGDDVDICWQLQRAGWTLGFSPAAVVWHHRRNSVRAYWRQQQGYGRAEALLERKWPEKYNAAGHLTWAGRIYGRGLTHTLGWRHERIVYGTWGSAPFQPAYQTAPGLVASLLLMPEWHLLSGALGVLAALSLFWHPLMLAVPLLLLTVGASLGQAALGAAHAHFSPRPRGRGGRAKRRTLTALLHLLQPLARLYGRRSPGVRFATRREDGALTLPRTRQLTLWSERWQPPNAWLGGLEAILQDQKSAVLRGGAFDRWDLEVRSGRLGAVRLRMASEEHGAGRQLLRFRAWPHVSPAGVALLACCMLLAGSAAHDHAWGASAVFGVAGLAVGLRLLYGCASAMAAAVRALRLLKQGHEQAGPAAQEPVARRLHALSPTGRAAPARGGGPAPGALSGRLPHHTARHESHADGMGAHDQLASHGSGCER